MELYIRKYVDCYRRIVISLRLTSVIYTQRRMIL